MPDLAPGLWSVFPCVVDLATLTRRWCVSKQSSSASCEIGSASVRRDLVCDIIVFPDPVYRECRNRTHCHGTYKFYIHIHMHTFFYILFEELTKLVHFLNKA